MEDSKYDDLQLPFYENDHKVQRKSIPKIISGCFSEFLRNTSIHGCKYLPRKGCIFERLWWVAVLGFCIYTCTILTIMTLKKREENPVFVSFRQTPMHIWDIPIPAVTICSINRIKAVPKCSKHDMTVEELTHFMDIKFAAFHQNLSFHKMGRGPEGSSLDYLVRNSPQLDDILDLCMLSEESFHCKKIFSPILTSSGLCFSFNMLDKSELFRNITYLPEDHVRHKKSLHWNFDTNYIKTLNDTFPIRMTSFSDAIYFRLKIPKFLIDPACELCKGFKIILHHPADMPTFANRYVLLSLNQNHKIWIKPDITTTSDNLADYSPEKRGCLFSNERKLKFFKIYTFENCKVEWVSNYTSKRCDCVPYYMPHEKTTKICGVEDMLCVFNIRDEYLSLEMEIDFLQNSSDGNMSGERFNCLPSCTSIIYNAEATPEHYIHTNGNNYYITVHTSFRDSNFITMERNELFSSADFWASCGGLLGLFTGFSVVSLAEIIYFFTLKWICVLWNIRKRT